MLSLIPPFILITLVVFYAFIAGVEGEPRDLEISIARQMMQVHTERTLEARSNEFNPLASDMTALPGYPVSISTEFTTEIVSAGAEKWIITWPTDPGLSQDQAQAVTSQLALLGFQTPGTTSINDFNGAYDALNDRIDEFDIPSTGTAIPDLYPVIATRYY
jgi:hypothetical protein